MPNNSVINNPLFLIGNLPCSVIAANILLILNTGPILNRLQTLPTIGETIFLIYLFYIKTWLMSRNLYYEDIDDIKILEDYTYVKKIVNIGIPSLIILILIFSGILYLNPYILGRSTSTKDLYISIVVPLLAPIYFTLQIWLCLFQQRIWVLCC
jgi:hypothetical protein